MLDGCASLLKLQMEWIMDCFPPEVYHSNDMEVLSESLAAHLYGTHTTPFTERIVLVSSGAMKQWLSCRLAHQSGLGVLTGVKLLYPWELFQRCHASLIHHPFLLGVCVEAKMEELLEREGEDPFWEGVKSLVGERGFSSLRGVRVSRRLAALFSQYGTYGEKLLSQWRESPPSHWQGRLWLELMGKELLPPPSPLEPGAQLHLFAPAFLPKQQMHWLENMSRQGRFFIYCFSPCQAFWSDIRSDRESVRLKKFWSQRGASTAQIDALEELLRERNPLLANFGRLGRVFQQEIEGIEALTAERYLFNANAPWELYGEELSEQSCVGVDRPWGLLQGVQMDLLTLRDGTLQPHPFSGEVNISVHRSPTLWREVEVLYENILALFRAAGERGEELFPQDILVMAPDVNLYAPFIQALFAHPESQLPFQIQDASSEQNSLYLEGVQALFQLFWGRWELGDVKALLEHPYFMECFALSADEVVEVGRWCEDLGVSWGYSVSQREEVLRFEGCHHTLEEGVNQGVWEESFSQLIQLFCQGKGGEIEGVSRTSLSLSQGELLGKVLSALHSLHSDFSYLRQGEKRALKEWGDFLDLFLESYLKVPGEDRAGKRDRERLLLLGRCPLADKDRVQLSFFSYMNHLKEHWEQQTCVRNEHALEAIRFCSLVPMRSVPAEHMFLLGMDKESFPRKEGSAVLNELWRSGLGDYCPSRVDFDRYLFLESLLSAKQTLTVSYTDFCFRDQGELFPSTVVSELVHYLDRAYLLSGGSFSDVAIHRHSLQGWKEEREEVHPRLQPGGGERTVSQESKRGFVSGEALSFSLPDLLDVKELLECWRNPLKTFLWRSLGVRLGDEKREDLEPLALHGWTRFALRRKGMGEELTALSTQLERVGEVTRVPSGIWMECAQEELEEEVKVLQQGLKEGGVPPEEWGTVTLSPSCEQPEQVGERHWAFPPLVFSWEGKSVQLCGTLEQVGPGGMVGLGEGSVQEVAKGWAQWVLVQELIHRWELSWKPRWLFPKKEKIFPSFSYDPTFFQDLCEHYLSCRTQPSLLFPEWVQLFLVEEEHLVSKVKGMVEGGSRAGFYHPEVSWMFGEAEGALFESHLFQAREQAEKTFTPMVRSWFPRMAAKLRKNETL